MKRLLLALVLIMLLVAIAVEGCAQPTPTPAPQSSPAPAPKPAEAIKWRLQTAMQPTHPHLLVYCKAFMELVKEKGKGGLEIQLLAQGEILVAPQLFQGVMDGKVEMGASQGVNHGSLVPEAVIEFSQPYGLATSDQFYDFYYKYKDGAFLKKLQEAYREKGNQLLGVSGNGVTLITKFPINKVDDLKGKRILNSVGPTAPGHNLITAAGGTVVFTPSPQQYAALQAGTADGTLNTLQDIIPLKLAEVTSYISFPRTGFVAPDLYCNLAVFNSLPADLQKAVQEAAVEAALKVDGPGYPARETENIEAGKKAGVTVITLPDEEVAKMRALAIPIWDEAAAKSPRCTALVDMLKSYLKEKGILK